MQNKLNAHIKNTLLDKHKQEPNLDERVKEELRLIDDGTEDSIEEVIEYMYEQYNIGDNFNRAEFTEMSLDITKILMKKIQNNLPYKDTAVYKFSLILDEELTKQIVEPINSLIDYHINKNEPTKLIALMTAFKCLDLEDEVKKLTLTDEQYKTWLETDITHINTKQFEILFGITERKQAELRSWQKDHLPSFQIDGKGKHYYNKLEVMNWLDNYKRLNPFK